MVAELSRCRLRGQPHLGITHHDTARCDLNIHHRRRAGFDTVQNDWRPPSLSAHCDALAGIKSACCAPFRIHSGPSHRGLHDAETRRSGDIVSPVVGAFGCCLFSDVSAGSCFAETQTFVGPLQFLRVRSARHTRSVSRMRNNSKTGVIRCRLLDVFQPLSHNSPRIGSCKPVSEISQRPACHCRKVSCIVLFIIRRLSR